MRAREQEVNPEIKEILTQKEIKVQDLKDCWKKVQTEYEKSASSFKGTYFGEDNTENWLNPGTIDLIDFSQLDVEALKRYKEDTQSLLLNPSNDLSIEQKIIYAFLWKNAGIELNKIPAIITGLLQEKISEDSKIRDCYNYTNLYSDVGGSNSTIFYQYGLYLKTKKDGNINFTEVEPIVDQHTLRAWSSLNDNREEEPIQNYDNIRDYKNFYKNIIEKASEGDIKKSKEAFYLLNAIMFVIGKAIK